MRKYTLKIMFETLILMKYRERYGAVIHILLRNNKTIKKLLEQKLNYFITFKMKNGTCRDLKILLNYVSHDLNINSDVSSTLFTIKILMFTAVGRVAPYIKKVGSKPTQL